MIKPFEHGFHGQTQKITAFSQLIIETFRGDSLLIANGIKQNQTLAWILIALCFLLMELRMKQIKKLD